jgi:hypothetical protein
MNINALAKLEDANIFLLKMPESKDPVLVIGTMHPFDLDGRGHEARVYRLVPTQLEISEAARAASRTGWGIDEIATTATGNLTVARDEYFISISVQLPFTFMMRSAMLSDHPELGEQTFLTLEKLNEEGSQDWKRFSVEKCHDGAW